MWSSPRRRLRSSASSLRRLRFFTPGGGRRRGEYPSPALAMRAGARSPSANRRRGSGGVAARVGGSGGRATRTCLPGSSLREGRVRRGTSDACFALGGSGLPARAASTPPPRRRSMSSAPRCRSSSFSGAFADASRATVPPQGEGSREDPPRTGRVSPERTAVPRVVGSSKRVGAWRSPTPSVFARRRGAPSTSTRLCRIGASARACRGARARRVCARRGKGGKLLSCSPWRPPSSRGFQGEDSRPKKVSDRPRVSVGASSRRSRAAAGRHTRARVVTPATAPSVFPRLLASRDRHRSSRLPPSRVARAGGTRIRPRPLSSRPALASS